MMRGLSWVSRLSDMLNCEVLQRVLERCRARENLGVMRCVLGRLFWRARGWRFVDLYYAIFVSFVESFAPVGSRVLVFATLSAFLSAYLLSFPPFT